MFLVKLISWLPFSVLYRISDVLYFLLFRVVRYRLKVVRANVDAAFPEKSVEERQQIIQRFYRHLADLALEVLKSPGMSAEQFMERCTLRGSEAFLEHVATDSRPIIVLALHQGNWEWMLHAVSQKLNIPIDPVYKTLRSQAWDQFMLEARGRFNSKPIPMQRAARDIIKRKKEFRLFVMLADQKPIEGESGYWLPFLERPAPFYQGIEKIAQLTQLPVYFVQCHTVGRGRYEVELSPLALPPHAKTNGDEHPIMDPYVDEIVRCIKEQPETYLWSHARWIRTRPGPNDTVSPSAQAMFDQNKN